jgi:hypothetical protein
MDLALAHPGFGKIDAKKGSSALWAGARSYKKNSVFSLMDKLRI